jgi:hypothetical protein
MIAAAAGNGERPHIDLNAVLGDRARIRDVTLGDRTYQFRPLNLLCGQLLDDGKVVEAFRALIVDGVDEFMEAAPVADLAAIITAIYGVGAVGKPEPPSSSSPRKRAASKPSKRTSSPADSH